MWHGVKQLFERVVVTLTRKPYHAGSETLPCASMRHGTPQHCLQPHFAFRILLLANNGEHGEVVDGFEVHIWSVPRGSPV